MSGLMGRVLIVDDDPDGLQATARILSLEGYEIEKATDGQNALERIRELKAGGQNLHAILSDVRMPRMSGLEFFSAAKAISPRVPFVLMTAYGQVEDAVWAMKMGAVDFLTKPFGRKVLIDCIGMAVQRGRFQGPSEGQSQDLMGVSIPMQNLKSDLAQIALSEGNVLILGESGSGKERVARSIHKSSSRAQKPFIAVNCASLPETLFESELFGHARGAFTGAHTVKRGLFEEAQGGILFLDEIGELPMSAQAKLLRVLEQKSIRRVGANTEIPINVRLVAATHRDLKTWVKEGRFREDLLFRLDVLTLQVPPLRERKEDIAPLALSFLQEASSRHQKSVSGLDPQILSVLETYTWPGNVRELANVIERAVVLCRDQEIKIADLPPHVSGSSNAPKSVTGIPIDVGMSLERVESLMIERALEAANGNKQLAARLLGMSSRTFYRRLSRAANVERNGAGSPNGDESHSGPSS